MIANTTAGTELNELSWFLIEWRVPTARISECTTALNGMTLFVPPYTVFNGQYQCSLPRQQSLDKVIYVGRIQDNQIPGYKFYLRLQQSTIS